MDTGKEFKVTSNDTWCVQQIIKLIDVYKEHLSAMEQFHENSDEYSKGKKYQLRMVINDIEDILYL